MKVVQVSTSQKLKHLFLDNLSYKLVSLFVALILWVSILGRRDFVATKEIEVGFVLAPGYSISSQSHDRVKVKLSGPQPLLKKYKETMRTIYFDLSNSEVGEQEVEISTNQLDIPKGIKALGVRPNLIKIEIIKNK